MNHTPNRQLGPNRKPAKPYVPKAPLDPLSLLPWALAGFAFGFGSAMLLVLSWLP